MSHYDIIGPLPYPGTRSWLHNLDFDPEDRQPVQYRTHLWIYDDENYWYSCGRCGAVITDRFLLEQTITEHITDSALDLIWYMYAYWESKRAYLCPQ